MHWNVVLGAFQWPAGDLAFDDAGVASRPSGWPQPVQEFSDRCFGGAGESAGGKCRLFGDLAAHDAQLSG
jgi:hypothetical protein